MRARILLGLILLMMPILSGCWSRIEVNDLAFVTAAGIDKMEDGKIRLALQVAIPRMLSAAGQGGFGGEKGIGTETVWVVSEKGGIDFGCLPETPRETAKTNFLFP